MNIFKNVLKIIGDVLIGIIIIIGLTFLVSLLPIKNNYKVLSVMSGSMEPTIRTGSLVFTQPSNDYKVGEIITFYPANSTSKKNTTTHRIVGEIKEDGDITFTTKGDANSTADSQPVKKDRIVGKYIFKISYLGYLISFIKTLPGLVIIIIIPATIIVYEEMKKIHHETKHIIHKRREKKLAKVLDKEVGNNKGEKNETS